MNIVTAMKICTSKTFLKYKTTVYPWSLYSLKLLIDPLHCNAPAIFGAYSIFFRFFSDCFSLFSSLLPLLLLPCILSSKTGVSDFILYDAFPSPPYSWEGKAELASITSHYYILFSKNVSSLHCLQILPCLLLLSRIWRFKLTLFVNDVCKENIIRCKWRKQVM